MKKFVKYCVVLIAVAGLMGVMSGTAMAKLPDNGIIQDSVGNFTKINDTMNLIDTDPTVVSSHDEVGPCVEGFQQVTHTTVDSDGNMASSTWLQACTVEDGSEGTLGEPPVAPDDLTHSNVPVTPETTAEIPPERTITTKQPPTTTQETPEPPSSSKLPNTGSSLALLAAFGAMLMAGAMGARVLMTRRVK